MNRLILPIFCCLVFLCSNLKLKAQGDCLSNLAQCKELFQEGQLGAVLLRLTNCRKSRALTKVQRVEVLELLVKANLELNRGETAKSYFIEILKIYPTYKADPLKEPNLAYLAKHFKRTPWILYGIKGGANDSFVSVNQDFSADDFSTDFSVDIRSEEYTSKTQLQVGAFLDFVLLKTNFDLSFGLNFTQRRYTYANEGTVLDLSTWVKPVESRLNFFERQNWLELPVLVKYNLQGGSFLGRENRPERKFAPNIIVGFVTQRLLSARMENIQFVIENNGDRSQHYGATGKELLKETNNSLRNKWNYAWLIGLGGRLKLGDYYLVADLSYSKMLSNLSNGNKKVGNPINEPIGQLRDLAYYTEDDFTFHNLAFQIGIMYAFNTVKRYDFKVNQ